ncbi:MAG: enoyl-CoA hydratase/isomerase family protein [Phycisphaerae bacterium]
MSKTQIHLEISGESASITLRTEDGPNVMSSAVLKELQSALADIRGSKGVRWTVVRGEGKVFVAGADIKEMANYGPDEARAYGQLGQSVLKDLATLPCVTVASINGAALGGGLELALACDFRLAVRTAKVGLPETSLGLIPGWSGIPRLTKLVGEAAAKRLFFSALPIPAEDGVAMGLIDEVVNSADDLDSRVPVYCRSFRRGSPEAIALAKRASLEGNDLDMFAACFGTDDAREGISAFVDKRIARWMEGNDA